MLVECFIISEFVSQSTKLSTRALFLDVVKASIDFLLEMDIQSAKAAENEKRVVETANEDDASHQILMTKISLSVTPRGMKMLESQAQITEINQDGLSSVTDRKNSYLNMEPSPEGEQVQMMAVSRMRRRITLVNRDDPENKFGRQTKNESQTFSKLLLTDNDDLRGVGSQPVVIED